MTEMFRITIFLHQRSFYVHAVREVITSRMSSRESCKNPLDLLATSKCWTMYAKHIWMKTNNVVRVINDIHRARLRRRVRVWEDILCQDLGKITLRAEKNMGTL